MEPHTTGLEDRQCLKAFCHLLVVCNYYCCNGVIIVDGVCVSVLCRCSRKDRVPL